jgi:hypothetical protein
MNMSPQFTYAIPPHSTRRPRLRPVHLHATSFAIGAISLATVVTIAAGCGNDDSSARPAASSPLTTSTIIVTTMSLAPHTSAATRPGRVELSDPPTAAEVSKLMQELDPDLDRKVADCAANIYVHAGISKEGMEKNLSADGSSSMSSRGLSPDDLAKVEAAAVRTVLECLS